MDSTSYSPPPKVLFELGGIVLDADGKPVADAVVGFAIGSARKRSTPGGLCTAIRPAGLRFGQFPLFPGRR